MPRATREIWAKRVERWATSGLTAAEFAQETGLNAKTLTFWKWRLGRGSASKPSRSRSTFVEVRPDEATQTSAASELEAIEIIVRDGIRIRVPVRFDADILRRVVAAVEAR